MAQFILMGMSSRKDSLNKKLILCAQKILSGQFSDSNFEVLQINDFNFPIFDEDLETKSGIPENVNSLSQKISNSQGIIFSTPEYNGMMPAIFKNLIDWVSRVRPLPWSEKQILLLGASPGALGAIRALGNSRGPLESCGAFVFPEMFGLAKANLAFDENESLKDPQTQERLKRLLIKFTSYAVHNNKMNK